MFAFSTEELQLILLQLDQAIYNHEQWSKALNRTLICRSLCDQRDMSPEAHRNCQFGQWYYHHASSKLWKMPAFTAIESEHAQMHELAARLLVRIASGTPISPYDYDSFSGSLERLRLHIHSLKRELSEQLYNSDPLTGTNARIGLLTELREQHELVKRDVQARSLSMMDLDHFKSVNDTYGHQTGDQVLVESARYLMGNLRPYDRIFRYGGEEFFICLPGMDTKAAHGVIERLREGLSACLFSARDGAVIKVTASFGLTVLDATLPVEGSLDRADKALYAAKTAGRNCVRVWDAGM